jgi:hypothetical protein
VLKKRHEDGIFQGREAEDGLIAALEVMHDKDTLGIVAANVKPIELVARHAHVIP